MKQILHFPVIVILLAFAPCDASAAETEVAKPKARVRWSADQVEKAATAAKNADRLLGSLLSVTSRHIEGRYFYQNGLWWYWTPNGYWMVSDGESWIKYER